MKTFTEMFAKSQLASTSHPNGICVCHIVNSKSTKYARKKGFEFLKSFVLHDMTWQSVYHPLKPCVRIDFYAWMQTLSHSTTTLIYALMIHIGHWAVGARKCTLANMTKLSLCVMHVWRAEKAAAHQKTQQANDKFIYDFCLTCLEAFVVVVHPFAIAWKFS